MGRNSQPACHTQSVVDPEDALVFAHSVVLKAADSHRFKSMREAAKALIGLHTFNVVTNAGYSQGRTRGEDQADQRTAFQVNRNP
jgi:hypothetical protein